MDARNIYAELVSVSRDCGFTRELAQVLSTKLDENERRLLKRWLQILQQDQQIEKNRIIRKVTGFNNLHGR